MLKTLAGAFLALLMAVPAAHTTGLVAIIDKSVMEQVSSSDTLQPDDELKFTVPAGQVYVAQFVLDYYATVDADIRLSVNCPDCEGGTNFITGYDINLPSGTNTTGEVRLRTQLFGTEATFGGVGNDASIIIQTIAYAPAEQDAEVVLYWAQGSSKSTATKVMAKSFVIVFEQ